WTVIESASHLRLNEIIKTFLEDPDPESMLDVGADMRKIKHCFNYIKQLINRTNIPDRSLLSPDITGDEDTNIPEKKEELKKLRDLLHQRDNEINILYETGFIWILTNLAAI
ncbi:unnamed protein product, partial [Caretta caretta]